MKLINQANKIIIKIGSSFIVDSKNAEVNQSWIDSFVDDVVALRKEGKKVILVSSGAVVLGCKMLGINSKKIKLQDKQNAAVSGQYEMIDLYKKSFARYEVNVAQILMTTEDVENRKRSTSIQTVIDYLLEKNIVPIVNENNLIANTEIRFGDNDRLSARVAQMTKSDLLILLSLMDGLFTANPEVYQGSSFVSEVFEVTSDVERMASDSKSKTGGMSAKIVAARAALSCNCNAIIMNGISNNPLKRLLAGERCSLFISDVDALQKYKIGN
jgi:glutamate 5-kinase